MRAIRIVLTAWAAVLLVMLAVPNLRAHLAYTGRSIVADFPQAYKPLPVPQTKDEEFLFAVHEANRPWGSSVQSNGLTSNLDPLVAYCKKYPDEVGPKAMLVRMAITAPGKVIDAKVLNRSMWEGRASQLISTSREMQKIEPDNWYWRLGEVTGLRSLGRESEIGPAISRVPLPTRYDDYAIYEPLQINEIRSKTFWGITPMERTYNYAMVLFPHLAGYKAIARERSSQPGYSPEENRAWILCSLAMASDARYLIGALVGRGMLTHEVVGIKNFKEGERAELIKAALPGFRAAHAGLLSPHDLDRVAAVVTPKWDYQPPAFEETFVMGMVGEILLSLSLVGAACALVALVPWRIAPRTFWMGPMIVFVCCIPMGSEQFDLARWGAVIGWQSNTVSNALIVMIDIALVLATLITIGLQKWRVGRPTQVLFAVGVFALVAITQLQLATACALLALLSQGEDRKFGGWMSPALLLWSGYFLMTRYNPAMLGLFALGLTPMVLFSRQRSLVAPTAALSLVLLVMGLAATRDFDLHAMDWVDDDVRQLTHWRIDAHMH